MNNSKNFIECPICNTKIPNYFDVYHCPKLFGNGYAHFWKEDFVNESNSTYLGMRIPGLIKFVIICFNKKYYLLEEYKYAKERDSIKQFEKNAIQTFDNTSIKEAFLKLKKISMIL